MKKINLIAIILLIIGGFNWGLVGVLNFNLVDFLFAKMWLDKVIYFLVGVSAVYAAFSWKKLFK
ncbi:MAG: DUF378 domain-containing protein [Chlamydiae bacterium]|nr:DUF378 domain-containing protein [Chlamydiota bacterium]